MKAILLCLIVMISFANAEHFNIVVPGRTAQNVNHPPNNPTHFLTDAVHVPSGGLFTVQSINGDWQCEVDAWITVGGVSIASNFTSATQRDKGDFDLRFPTSITGPATIRFFGDYHGGAKIVCYSIQTADESSKSNAAVIPDDNSGDHEVVLEASADLKTWEPVQPGSYPTTATRRFFRVRVQKQ